MLIGIRSKPSRVNLMDLRSFVVVLSATISLLFYIIYKNIINLSNGTIQFINRTNVLIHIKKVIPRIYEV